MANTNRPQWKSQIGFILAMIGSAVGLGNIWRFPYIMGKNGGAVFLLVYLILIFSICFIPFLSELIIGKTYKKSPMGVFKEIGPRFKIVGWSCTMTAILITAFYVVVGGWILNFIWIYISQNVSPNVVTYFNTFVSKPTLPLFFTFLFLLFSSIASFCGVNKGIERANVFMMPLFIFMLITLVIYSLTFPNASKGLEFMFNPDFSKINFHVILMAFGQALFTLSIGIGAIIVYGSYLKDDVNLIRSATTIIIMDTLIAILAGIMIFPAIFSFGLTPETGPSLIFVTMPQVFSKIPFGSFVAVLFFILIFFAAVSSAISMIESVVASFMEKFEISRRKSTIIVTALIAILSIFTTLSFSTLKDFKIFNLTIFDLFDFSTSNILLPLNTLAICIAVGWYINPIHKKIFRKNYLNIFFDFALKFIIPVVLVVLLITGLE